MFTRKFKKTVAIFTFFCFIFLNSIFNVNVKKNLNVSSIDTKENLDSLLQQYKELKTDDLKEQVFIELYIDYVDSLDNFVEEFKKNESLEKINNLSEEFVFNFAHFSNILGAVYDEHKLSEPIKMVIPLVELHGKLSNVASVSLRLVQQINQKENTNYVNLVLKNITSLISNLKKISLEFDEGKTAKTIHEENGKFLNIYSEICEFEKTLIKENDQEIGLNFDETLKIISLLKNIEENKTNIKNSEQQTQNQEKTTPKSTLDESEAKKRYDDTHAKFSETISYFCDNIFSIAKIKNQKEAGTLVQNIEPKAKDLYENIEYFKSYLKQNFSQSFSEKCITQLDVFKDIISEILGIISKISNKNSDTHVGNDLLDELKHLTENIKNFCNKNKTLKEKDEINKDREELFKKIDEIKINLAVRANSKNAKGNNWMSMIPDSKKIVEMSLVGTHDSITYLPTRNLTLYNFKAQCQSKSIKQQLEAGVRDFDIRLNGKGELIHGDVLYKGSLLEDVLKPCVNFLKNNPTEAVALSGVRGRPECKRDDIKNYISEGNNGTLGNVRGKISFDSFGVKNTDYFKSGEWQGPHIQKKFENLKKHINQIDSEYKNKQKEQQLGSASLAATAGFETVKKIFSTIFTRNRKLTPKSYADFFNPEISKYIRANSNNFLKVGKVKVDFAGTDTGKNEFDPSVVYKINFNQ